MGNTVNTPASHHLLQVPSYLRRRSLPRVPAVAFLARPPAANDPALAASWQQQARARAAARQATTHAQPQALTAQPRPAQLALAAPMPAVPARLAQPLPYRSAPAANSPQISLSGRLDEVCAVLEHLAHLPSAQPRRG